MQLLSSRDHKWPTECEVELLAQGIVCEWVQHLTVADVAVLEVAPHQAELAVAILSNLLGEKLARQPEPTFEAQVPLMWRPAFATALCLSLAMLIFYAATGAEDSGSPWHTRGVLRREAVVKGHQWWRLVTAATLHADVRHVLGNATFVVVLGWGAAERLGSGVMLLVWLVTAVAGFGASLATSSTTTMTLGASGGLFGLLGAAATGALLQAGAHQQPRRRRTQILGAALMLLSFTAFGPQANVPAHLGGFVAGAFVGLAARWQPALSQGHQRLLALIACGTVLGAWLCAWQSDWASVLLPKG